MTLAPAPLFEVTARGRLVALFAARTFETIAKSPVVVPVASRFKAEVATRESRTNFAAAASLTSMKPLGGPKDSRGGTATDGDPWKAHVLLQLRRRDREQCRRFRDLVCAYSGLLDKSGATDWILASGRRGAVSPSRAQLKKAAGELAYQVVERQQQMKMQDDVLEEQRDRLLQDERRLAGARDLRLQLRLRAERLGERNGRLKAEYDALMERQGRAERRLREEKLRGSGLLEDVMALKRQAAARLNQRNHRRSRAQDVNLQKELQTAATSQVNVDSSLGGARWRCLALKKKPAEKSPAEIQADFLLLPFLRSAPASHVSPRIPASIRDLFERRRGRSRPAAEEEEPARPVRVPAAARVPGRALHVLEAHEQGVNAAAFCPSSALLASAGTDRVVKVWQVRAGALRHQTTLDGSTEGLTCVQFDPTGHRILAGSYDKSALLWCLDRPVAKLTLTGHGRKVTAARFSRHQVVTGSADGTVRMWDLQRAACVHLAQASSFCSDVVCSENVAISGHFDRKIRLWDTRLSSCVRCLSAQGKVTSLDLSADGRHLLSCCRDDGLQLLDVRRWSHRGAAFRAEGFKCASDSTKVAISASVSAVCWSSSGEYAASVDKKGRAVLWSDL
ncbi:ATG16 autophagy related 16-like 2 isoform X2 [Hippocampus comes]|uniref:ATG16 autophagy related 16-like 2 isoform X2 n=1 Tax=Hippocampus comes TaxID=109280 RepID=UPI00094EEA4A|nr:PREDICTED: autophagy-related protein 16-2-like isoform X2 [Hippocampus comes]